MYDQSKAMQYYAVVCVHVFDSETVSDVDDVHIHRAVDVPIN